MLTDAKIRALKPAATRYLTTDGRGLALNVLPTGITTWQFRYRLNGNQEKVTLGRYPDLSLAIARKERDRLAQLVAAGTSPAHEKKQARGDHSEREPTLRSFADRYFKEQIAPNLKNPADVRRYLDNEICPVLGDRLLKDVGVLDCQRLIYRKRDKGRIITALQLRAILKQLFDYALELQLVTANPAAQCATKYIGKIRKRTRALSPSEIRSVLRTLDASDIQRPFQLALRVTLLTLTRKSELRLTEWKDVNLETGEWFIPAANTETNVDHVVYISTQVAEMFRELRLLACGSEYVLPGKSSIHKPMHENSLNAALDRVSFDVPPFVIHDFRRTASTILHANHFQPDVIELALGHKIPGIRGVYNVAPYAAERKKMLQWWGDYVDSVVNDAKVIVGNFGT